MSRPGLLLVALLTAGCETNHPPGPPPQDSGSDFPSSHLRPVAERGEWPGHPERLPAGRWRVVRGDVEVHVNYTTSSGDRLVVSLTVLNRNKERPLAFADWARPDQVTLRDDNGKAYPLLPLPADRARALRELDAAPPDPAYGYGPGPVTHDRGRVATLEFDRAAADAWGLDLDLAGAPVGSADPILFRLPRGMLTNMTLGVP